MRLMEMTDRQFEIIGAAGRILTEAGLGGLTTKKLAQEVGFSESALYRHFKSKEKILIAMLEYLAKEMDQRLSSISTACTDAEEHFRRLFQSQFTFFNQHPYFVVAVFSDGLLEESQSINATILKIMAVKMKHLMAIVEKGQQAGLFTKEISAKELVHISMGSFRLQMFKWRIANFEFDIRQEGKNLIGALLKIIKTNGKA